MMILSASAMLAAPGPAALADEALFEVDFTGAAMVPPVDTSATGFVRAVYNTETREIVWLVTFEGLSGPATAIRLHGPATAGENGDTVMTLGGNLASPIVGGSSLSVAAGDTLMAGLLYMVICTAAFPDGEIRVQFTNAEIEPAGSME
jgi:hypothetical protein